MPTYGYVKWQVFNPASGDASPVAAEQVSIKITPVSVVITDDPATVAPAEITCTVNSDGWMTYTPATGPAVTVLPLIVGQYRVRWNGEKMSLKSFPVDVLDTYTELAPGDLSVLMGTQVAPGTVEVVQDASVVLASAAADAYTQIATPGTATNDALSTQYVASADADGNPLVGQTAKFLIDPDGWIVGFELESI